MQTPQHFTAPWGKLLLLFTGFGVVVLGGVTVAILTSTDVSTATRSFAATASLAVLLLAVPFACRGYRLERGDLVIERLGWEHRVSLKGLKQVVHDNELINGALRVGNGGLFVFAGWFWNRRLGWFRLVGNDIIGRVVVLDFGERKWMITPEDPNAFVAAAKQYVT